MKMKVQVGDTTFMTTLAENSSADAEELREALGTGDVTVTLSLE